MEKSTLGICQTPPSNIEAERAVLGAIMLRNQALESLDTLTKDDFYDPRNRAIYEAVLSLDEQGSPIDPLTLGAELSRVGSVDGVGGLSYLSDLVGSVVTADNISHYARIVQEKARIRRLISVASGIATDGFGDYGDADEFMEKAERKVFEVTQGAKNSGPRAISPILKETFSILEKRLQAKDGITGVSTGYQDLDSMTAGLQPSDLVILAARPSMGKTALALNIAQNATLATAEHPILFFSLEMSSPQLAERMLCSEARIDSSMLRRGKATRGEVQNLLTVSSAISKAPIMIDDTPAPTVGEIRARARRWRSSQTSESLGLVVVDYLQLMKGSRSRQGNREQEISEISRGLKGLAKELGCPVLALSQLSRKCEERLDKRPILSDLRESGAIEQDADVIMFIYREEVYAKSKTLPDERGVAEVIIGKQRNGPIGTVKLAFRSQFTRFESLRRD